MKKEITTEILRRFNLIIEHAPRNTMQFGFSGSRILFRIGLSLIGHGDYSYYDSILAMVTQYQRLKNEKIIDYDWIDDKFKQPCMTIEEFNSDIYDEFLDNLFNVICLLSEYELSD